MRRAPRLHDDGVPRASRDRLLAVPGRGTGDAVSGALRAALCYRALGCSVIPLRPGDKKPALEWAPFRSRRATPDEIRAWYRDEPAAGVAIICGAISGLVVLDVDPRNRGDESVLVAIEPAARWHREVSRRGDTVVRVQLFLARIEWTWPGNSVTAERLTEAAALDTVQRLMLREAVRAALSEGVFE